MIHESYYWKQPLLRSARWLEKAVIDDESSDRILARAEREVFMGFYAIRKLLETFTLSTTTKLITYNLESFSARPGANPDHLNRTDIEKHYDFDSKNSETRNIEFICNQFIHSFVFVFALSEDGHIDGMFLSSDRVRHNLLYFIPITTVTQLFRTVGRDYPSEQHFERDNKTGQWRDVSSR